MKSSNSFIHRIDNTILINGKQFSVEVLRVFDPLYTLPTGIKSVKYTSGNGTGYHFQYDGARNIQAEWPCDRIEKYISNLTALQIIAKNLEEENQEIDRLVKNATTTYGDKRKLEYPSTDEMIVALWEFMVEGKQDSISEIQDRRLNIKRKYPRQ